MSADTPFFTVAILITTRPDALRHLIGRVALHSSKRLHRPPKAASELKWFNASQRSALVQLADFVAGSVYNWHKEGDPMVRLIEARLSANLTVDWRQIKARWLEK